MADGHDDDADDAGDDDAEDYDDERMIIGAPSMAVAWRGRKKGSGMPNR